MRVAVLLHKSVEHDSRVRRAARALAADGHEVIVLHLPRRRGELDGPLDGFEVRSVTPAGWVRRRLPAGLYRLVFLGAFVRELRRLRPDAVHANDAAMLAPGWAGARLTGADLVYDSHEYAAGVPYRKRGWRLLTIAMERALIHRCEAVITVSDGIAERLWSRYRLRCRPCVVRNLPDPAEHEADFAAPDLRADLGIGPTTPLVLHLGAVAPERGCETLVRAMAGLPRAHLLFLGADDGGFAAGLREIARKLGEEERVHLRPSVPTGQIRAYTRQASVGVTLLEDTCENHRLALPNKLFEYLASEVRVAASDLPEMRRAVSGLPAVTPVDPADPASVAAGLRAAIEAGPGGSSPFEWAEDAARLTETYARLSVNRCRDRGGAGRAVVLVRNGVSHDARVLREARLLDSLGYETTVVGVQTGAGEPRAERLGGVSVVRLEPGAGPRRVLGALRGIRARDGRPHKVETPRRAAGSGSPSRAKSSAAPRPASALARLRRFATTVDYYRRGLALVRRARPRLIHANDYNTAWIGVVGKWLTGAHLVYDSHELWPDRNLRPEPRPWLLLCESLFVRVADHVLTTSPGYARVMASRYRIDPPTVVRNVPEWRAVSTPNVEDGGRDSGPPLAVYFGALTRNRGLPTALRALTELPELCLRLVGPEAWGYRRTLLELAEQLGVAERLEMLDPVPPEAAAAVLADADVGLALIEPACLSYRMTLPNKLYEYVAAGLPVLASEIPVLAGEVREHRLGRVADPGDPAAVAAALRELLAPDAQRDCREAVARHAREAVWERERKRLAEVYAAPALR
jgi:glycosyltransferase involved in cell wall biosynthesis